MHSQRLPEFILETRCLKVRTRKEIDCMARYGERHNVILEKRMIMDGQFIVTLVARYLLSARIATENSLYEKREA